ncbi:MAG: serine/threonine-protein kinase [Planctomycetota bacterium]|jgi:uncharacterized protein YjbI with pentapeptide repeats
MGDRIKTYESFRLWCQSRKGEGESHLDAALEGLDEVSLSLTFAELEEGPSDAQVSDDEPSKIDSLPPSRREVIHPPAPEDAEGEGSLALSFGASAPSPTLSRPDDESGVEVSLFGAGRREKRKEKISLGIPEVSKKTKYRYKILHAAGGGMGVVYFCYDRAKSFPFVIKTFREDLFLKKEETLPRFIQEAEVWERMGTHPHIVQAYGTRILGTTPFLFLEFIAGGSLRDFLKKGPVGTRDAVEVALQTGLALKYAQKRASGFVHRDLKPSNILLDEDSIKITDLGLAHSLRREGVNETEVAGTPAYMAPEVWLGRAVSEKTDVYAIGVILFEMICRRLPFKGSDVREIRRAHLETSPPVIEAPHIPDSLSAWIERALRKEEEERPSLDAFIEGLKSVAEGEDAGKIQRKKPLAYFWASMPEFIKNLSRRSEVKEVLQFGDAFAGGIDEAIKNQLGAVKNIAMDDTLFRRLRALSRLYADHPEAFQKWNASTLYFHKIELRGRTLKRIFLPRVSFRHQCLAGADLDGAHLVEGDFRNTDLEGATFSRATLREADFRDAKCRNVNFKNATLSHAYLHRADLTGACFFGANLKGAKLRNVRLCKADLRWADLTGADLVDADLRGANLSGIDFRKTDLRRAKFAESNLENKNLQGIRFDRETTWPKNVASGQIPLYAPKTNLAECNLEGINLRKAILVGADLKGASMMHANLSEATVCRADFSRANLRHADLRGADLRFSSFQDANLHYTQLQGADLQDANFQRAKLWKTNLSGAKLKGANMKGAVLSLVTWPEEEDKGRGVDEDSPSFQWDR